MFIIVHFYGDLTVLSCFVSLCLGAASSSYEGTLLCDVCCAERGLVSPVCSLSPLLLCSCYLFCSTGKTKCTASVGKEQLKYLQILRKKLKLKDKISTNFKKKKPVKNWLEYLQI